MATHVDAAAEKQTHSSIENEEVEGEDDNPLGGPWDLTAAWYEKHMYIAGLEKDHVKKLAECQSYLHELQVQQAAGGYPASFRDQNRKLLFLRRRHEGALGLIEIHSARLKQKKQQEEEERKLQQQQQQVASDAQAAASSQP